MGIAEATMCSKMVIVEEVSQGHREMGLRRDIFDILALLLALCGGFGKI